jgi:hypothetical protein
MFIQQAAAGAAENIGTVTQVYDGTLTSDIQVRTFRNIDRLFPVRIVKHGPKVARTAPGGEAADQSRIQFRRQELRPDRLHGVESRHRAAGSERRENCLRRL